MKTLLLTTILPKLMKGNNWLYILLVILATMLYFSQRSRTTWKNTAEARETIITATQREYKDAQDRWVNETTRWQVTARDLKAANNSLNRSLEDKDFQITQQQRELGRIYQIAEEQGRRIRDLESANIAEMEARNQLNTKLRFLEDSLGNMRVEIDSIITNHLEIGFEFIPPDSLAVGHIYRNKIYTLVEIRAQRRDDGSKRWPFGNWIWLWGSESNVSVTSEDPDARITNNVSIQLRGNRIR